jgi:cardiolipin synthase (CMP-forming)
MKKFVILLIFIKACSLNKKFGMKKSGILNIPNIISLYRILISPLIVYFIIIEQESLFAVFLVLNLISDVVDGIVARRYNLESEFGARLDAMGDYVTYLLGFAGIYVFKLDELLPHLHIFIIFFGVLLSTVLVAILKFGKVTGFHLYSFKIGGYIQGLFFITLFTTGLITPLFYFMVIWGILASIEHIAIQLILPELRTDVKGIYWILKEKNADS